MHLHDNAGPVAGATGSDSHLALGLGVVDVGAVLAVARRAGASTIIEVLTPEGLSASVAYLRRERLIRPAETDGSAGACLTGGPKFRQCWYRLTR